jgi:hypothetical protein
MQKSVQWMTLQELRDEHSRTRSSWDELADLDDVLEDGELPALSEGAPSRAGTERVASATKHRLTYTVCRGPLGGDCCVPLVGAVVRTADRSRVGWLATTPCSRPT